MRYSASEKAEIIRLVGQSALPVKRTLEKLGIPRGSPVASRFRKDPLRLLANIYPASPDEIGAPKWGIRSRTPL
jgi:hypothetical protein